MAKKQIKKISLATILLLFAHNVWAYDFESGGLYYNITSDTTVAVTYKDNNINSYSGNITIPDTVLYNNTTYFVTSIGERVFYKCSGLTSVTIPNTVTSIGNYAFRDCSGLTSVTIPNSVTSIGELAFYNCSGLTSITIPDSVTSIGNYAFYGCSGLTSVTIPNSLTSIGNYAFYGCSGLTSVTIPNSLTSIGELAFYNCSGLTSITIPDSVTSIGNSAFYGCSGLTSVTIPNSVASIGNYAFSGCSSLTSVTIPNSVTSIGKRAFYFLPNLIYYGPAYNDGSNWGALCLNGYEEDSLIYTSSAKDTLCGAHKAITNANIPNSVTSIGNNAFFYCSGLTSVTIPNSVTRIGDSAFFYCSGLTSVTIPNSVTRIGDSAFYYCSGLTSVTIGNSVTSIGNSAFYYCTGLTSVTIPDSVTSIGNYAFSYCRGLTSVTIGNSVTSIGERAFYLCDSLTSITIPNSVTSIGRAAFSNCSGLTSVTIGNSVTSIGDYAFRECRGLTSITIPDSVTSIGTSAFSQCFRLTSVTIGNSVTSIGELVFANCDLTSVTIPNSVTSIGNSAFSQCYRLTSVTIGDSVTSIGWGAFSGCRGLTSVTIPNSVTSIGNNAFYLLPNLIYYGQAYNDGSNWGALCLNGYEEDSLIYTSSAKDTLCGAHKAITNANIPNSVTSIGRAAFYRCDSLTSVTIGDSVTRIGDSAFYYCSGLTSVTIPNSVTSIGNYAFSGCRGLTSVTFLGSNTSVGRIIFSIPDSIPIYIPCGSLSWYSNQGGLSRFSNKIEQFSYIYAVSSQDTTMGNVVSVTTPTTCANVTWTISATANYGYHFTRWSDGDTTNPRSIQVLSDTNITAEFDTNAYQLRLYSDTTQGTVIGGGVYKYSSTAIISATANYGYHFTQWSDGDTTNPRSIQVLSDTNIIAEFEANSYQLTLSTDTTQGAVIGGGVYKYLNTAIISATANYGYHFTQWSDGDTTNPRSIQVLSDTILIAYFTPTFVQSADTNQGTIQVQQAPTQENKQITVLAVPKSGYLFSHWEDFVKGQKKIHKDGNNTENPRTFIWEEGMTLIAYFTKETTGIEDVSDVNNAVHLYPNPAKTMLTIENATENVQIFDITGRMLMSIENKETDLLQINVSNLSKGMYFVKVGNYTTKFVKE